MNAIDVKSKIISTLKWVVRNLLQLTPAGRKAYARRKARQLQEVQDTLQREGPKILRLVHDAFAKAKIPYYVCDGTLLGLVREGGILPHDIDIDFTILPDDRGGGMPLLVYKTAMELRFRFFWAWKYDGQIANLAFDYHGVHIDFDFLGTETGDWKQFCFTKLDNVKYKNDSKWSVISATRPIVKDVKEQYVPKYDLTVNMPANYDEYLTSSYGNWRIPDTKWRENNLTVVSSAWKLMPLMGERVDESYFQGSERENCGLCEKSVPEGRH